MYYEKLRSLISPPKSPVYIGNENMHKKIDERLGIKLPDGYYKIIETYGAGSFHNCNKLFDLVVFNPYINDSNLKGTSKNLFWKKSAMHCICVVKLPYRAKARLRQFS